MKADKSLIRGAAQLAQVDLIGQQRKMQAIEGFGKTFSSVYNMIQQQKNAEKLAEKELYEDQRARYKEEMKDVNDVDYSFEALNAEQVNMYREFATSKKQRYSEIFYELENKSLTQQQRNDLEFEKSVILSDLRNSAASLAKATEKLNETRDSYDSDEISNSNFYTNPGSMSTLYDTMMRNNFSIDERGNAIVNLNYNLKATEQANDFVKINEDIRKQVRTYGINPLEKDEDKSLRKNKIKKSLDDNEVLSFMFDDLEINNGGYYDSVLAKNPQFKDEFNKMRTNLSDPNKRKDAVKYFKDIVSDELMKGIESNIQAGEEEYKVKNPQTSGKDSSSGSGKLSLSQQKEEKALSYIDTSRERSKDNPQEFARILNQQIQGTGLTVELSDNNLVIKDNNADSDDVMGIGKKVPLIDNRYLRQNILDVILPYIKSTQESENNIMFEGFRFYNPENPIQEVDGKKKYVGGIK
tara:strand:+ start:1019 stop:2422 length:1404 start_codon:yes stop_codon:yes gene_type:complete